MQVLVPSAFTAMKLKPDLTREQLQHLSDRELLLQLLACTPLNLQRVFLFALLYTLMPCAVLGPALGLLGTVGMAAVLAYLWQWGTPESMNIFLAYWLVWSFLALGLALLLQLIGGIRQYRRGRRYLAPEEAFSAELKPGERLELAVGEEMDHELVVQVPQRGVYVLVCRVDDCEGAVLFHADERACLVEKDEVPGLRTELRMAFRLEAGYHRLAVAGYCTVASRMQVMLR